jgi:hypothetical protein
MRRVLGRAILLTAAALACALPAPAAQFKEFEDNCGAAPYGPDIKMDPAISDEKVAELRKDVLAFIKASDQFQDCVTRMMDAGPTFKKEDASREKRIAIAVRFEREAQKIISDNQAEKERVGDDFNKLVELRKKPAAK